MTTKSRFCPLTQATQSPHPITDWWDKNLASLLQFRATLKGSELLMASVEAFVVQSNAPSIQSCFPHPRTDVKPLAHKSPARSLFSAYPNKEQSLICICVCPGLLWILLPPLCILCLSALSNFRSVSKHLIMKLWNRQSYFTPLDVKMVILSLLLWGGVSNRNPALLVPGVCLWPPLPCKTMKI